MRWECPQGFERYKEVLFRFVDVRRAGRFAQFRCLMESRHKNGDRNWSGIMWIGHQGELVARCLGCGAGFRELVAESGTDARDWFPVRWSRDQQRVLKMPNPILVATYKYCGREGELLFEKQRWEPGYDGRSKSMRFRRPLPRRLRSTVKVPENVESWVYGIAAQEYGRKQNSSWDWHPVRDEHQETLTIDAADPVLYRLPELLSPKTRKQPVFVCEGEKDVEILMSLGFVATCGPYGSSQWLHEWSGILAGRRVVVVPDHDHVGYTHADVVVGSCLRHGADSVRVVAWDDGLYDPGAGGGLGNWLPKVNGTGDKTVGRNAVIDLCTQSPEYSRPKTTA